MSAAAGKLRTEVNPVCDWSNWQTGNCERGELKRGEERQEKRSSQVQARSRQSHCTRARQPPSLRSQLFGGLSMRLTHERIICLLVLALAIFFALTLFLLTKGKADESSVTRNSLICTPVSLCQSSLYCLFSLAQWPWPVCLYYHFLRWTRATFDRGCWVCFEGDRATSSTSFASPVLEVDVDPFLCSVTSVWV